MDTVHIHHHVSVVPALVVGGLVLSFFLLIVWYYWRYRLIIRAANSLPASEATLPLMKLFFFGFFKDLHHAVCQYAKKCTGQTCCVWFGPHPVFFAVTTAKNIQAVISGSLTEKGSQYHNIKFILGKGLIVASDDVHKITSRHLNPLLQPRNLDQLTPDFNDTSRHFVHDLSQHVNKGCVEVSRPATMATIRIIARVVFGRGAKIDIKSKEFQDFLKAARGIGRVMVQRTLKPWLWPDSVFTWLWRKEVAEIEEGWGRFADKHLKKVKAQDKCNEVKDQSLRCDQGVISEPGTYLTLPVLYECLQQTHPQFTDKDMRQEMLTLILTGWDTSRVAIASCLLSLAAHTEIQERLYQEIISVVGPEDTDVTSQDIKNMPYLDQVFKETLRKYSIIPFIFRRAKEDIKLSDCTIPAGADICVSIMSLHFDPSVYPDPEKFDPERFAPERTTTVKMSFLPFSGGSRACVGGAYAALLVKTVVVHMLRRFRITTPMDISSLRYKLGIGLISEKGYILELHNR